MSAILTCNAGSTNTKLALFDSITLRRIGHTTSHDKAEAIEWICAAGEHGISAIGHRIVHGGRHFIQPVQLTTETLSALEKLSSLAPLHQPPALNLVMETQKLYPEALHIGCLDTAFHHTMPEVEKRLPLPRKFHDEGIMRYGFHGTSYQHVAEVLPSVAGAVAHARIIAAHLGGGSSACAMMNLKSVASTMGFSTLDGLMMGTRSGSIDAGVILHLMDSMNAGEITKLLYNESGLKGVSGISGNMKTLIQSNAKEAVEAIEHYCHSAAKHIASLIPSLGGVDGIVFTGGVGENSAPIRENIMNRLKWVGDVPVYVIVTDEESVIARACHNAISL